MGWPSSVTSAQGNALIESVFFGSVTGTVTVLPTGTLTVIVVLNENAAALTSSSCDPAGSIRLSIPVEPMTLPFSNTCISNGALIDTQPPAPPVEATDSSTDAVAPAVTLTDRFTELSPDVTATRCWPGSMDAMTSGVTPRGAPSTVTCAPTGSDVISRWPTAESVGERSIYWRTVDPASTMSGTVRLL